MIRYFRRHTRDRDSALDLAQDALTAFHAAGPEKLDNPAAYLTTIARNLAGRQRRKELWGKQHLRDLSPAAERTLSAEGPQPDDGLIFEAALQRAFSKLSASDQRLMTLWLYDFDPEEIADATKRPVEHVRRRLRAARSLLESHLNDPREGEPT